MLSSARWQNRRRMAWISLTAGLAYPLLVLFTDSLQLKDIAVPFYLFVSSVVGAYIGFATIDDKWQKDPDHGT
jgi:hypothetical protein